ncbi:UTP--glucose-1-phosphate uridylyltransferase [Quillaja saponaria]|uniref:UTP--glucose-1-phosphate uridylyltransferase n=1 Tax=Quillaja saponaria TaxID=32244 RepID=A0AAD7LP92_QUISA|nr:UTP--glucose-1-phosphate uridylyltransferase [Quillaja saponaria]
MEIARNSVKHSTKDFKLFDTKNFWASLNFVKRLVDTDRLKIENFSVSKERDNDQVLLQETAVGSSIRFFDDAIGIIVPQSRFLPMNATSDLLLLQVCCPPSY